MNDDLISRSALVEEFRKRRMSDAIPDYESLNSTAKCAVGRYADVTRELVFDAPAVEVAEVVRCKDCIHCGRSPFGYSPTMGWCKLRGEHRRYDYFCASGEQKAR